MLWALSVTTFGSFGFVILFHTDMAVWPDLANCRHFGKIINFLGNFMRVYLVFCILLNLLWQKLYAIGQISINVTGPNIKN